MDDFRIKTSWRTSRKRRRLKRILGAEAVLAIEDLWSYCAQERTDGDLSGLSNEEIADSTEWQGDADELVAAWVDCKLLDGEPGQYHIHDWHEHNPYVASHEVRVENGRKGGNKSVEVRRAKKEANEALLRLASKPNEAPLQLALNPLPPIPISISNTKQNKNNPSSLSPTPGAEPDPEPDPGTRTQTFGSESSTAPPPASSVPSWSDVAPVPSCAATDTAACGELVRQAQSVPMLTEQEVIPELVALGWPDEDTEALKQVLPIDGAAKIDAFWDAVEITEEAETKIPIKYPWRYLVSTFQNRWEERAGGQPKPRYVPTKPKQNQPNSTKPRPHDPPPEVGGYNGSLEPKRDLDTRRSMDASSRAAIARLYAKWGEGAAA